MTEPVEGIRLLVTDMRGWNPDGADAPVIPIAPGFSSSLPDIVHDAVRAQIVANLGLARMDLDHAEKRVVNARTAVAAFEAALAELDAPR